MKVTNAPNQLPNGVQNPKQKERKAPKETPFEKNFGVKYRFATPLTNSRMGSPYPNLK